VAPPTRRDRTSTEGFDVVEALVEHFDRGLLELGFNAVEGVVDDTLGDGFLAVYHQVVHELCQNLITELGVRQDFAFFSGVTT